MPTTTSTRRTRTCACASSAARSASTPRSSPRPARAGSAKNVHCVNKLHAGDGARRTRGGGLAHNAGAMNGGNRRDFLRALAAVLAAGGARAAAGAVAASPGNFGYVYSDPATREEFKTFLVNVFHLFPQDELHALILDATRRGLSDEQVYREVQG